MTLKGAAGSRSHSGPAKGQHQTDDEISTLLCLSCGTPITNPRHLYCARCHRWRLIRTTLDTLAKLMRSDR